jgi:hypothetical protein
MEALPTLLEHIKSDGDLLQVPLIVVLLCATTSRLAMRFRVVPRFPCAPIVILPHGREIFTPH